MYKLTIEGRLGRDAVVRESNGRQFISFTVAANVRNRGVDHTLWNDVIIRDVERYKNMLPYLKKGTMVITMGDFFDEVEEGRDGVNRVKRSIFADFVDFGGGGNSGSTATSATATATSDTRKRTTKVEEPEDSEPEPEEDGIKIDMKPKTRTRKKAEEPEKAPNEPNEPNEDDEEDLPF